MLNTPDQFYKESKRLIERYHGKGRNLYAITPRFAFGSSPALMEACERLKREFPDCWVNTHVSENPSEVRGVLAEHNDCTDYLGVYEKYRLVGPKFSGGHGVWLSDDEFRRLSKNGGAISFCPCSNLFLGSGLFRLGRATDPAARVKLNWGTDMGGGNRFSMLSVLDEAYKVGMCNNTLHDGSIDPARQDLAEAERNKVSPYRGFWSVTLGGAEGLYIDDRVGNFEPGKMADFVALDWNAGPPGTAWHQSLVVDDKAQSMDQAATVLFGVADGGRPARGRRDLGGDQAALQERPDPMAAASPKDSVGAGHPAPRPRRRRRPRLALWEARVSEQLKTWPGFVSHEAVPPSPPVNVDWTVVQHFADADAARAWLQSPDRAALVEEVRDLLVGQEEVHLLPEPASRQHAVGLGADHLPGGRRRGSRVPEMAAPHPVRAGSRVLRTTSATRSSGRFPACTTTGWSC